MMDSLRLNKSAKDQLTTLKRRTGIAHNNVLCRWALYRSLAEASSPLVTVADGEEGAEIKWETFAGEHSAMLVALMRHRCAREQIRLEESEISTQIRLHVHRGLGYLFGDRQMSGIESLLALTRESHSPAA